MMQPPICMAYGHRTEKHVDARTHAHYSHNVLPLCAGSAESKALGLSPSSAAMSALFMLKVYCSSEFSGSISQDSVKRFTTYISKVTEHQCRPAFFGTTVIMTCIYSEYEYIYFCVFIGHKS